MSIYASGVQSGEYWEQTVTMESCQVMGVLYEQCGCCPRYFRKSYLRNFNNKANEQGVFDKTMNWQSSCYISWQVVQNYAFNKMREREQTFNRC